MSEHMSIANKIVHADEKLMLDFHVVVHDAEQCKAAIQILEMIEQLLFYVYTKFPCVT